MKIPDPIAQAAINVGTNGPVSLVDRLTILQAVCAAISENPIVPTREQLQELEFIQEPYIYDSACYGIGNTHIEPWKKEKKFIVEWQRLMFLEPQANPVIRRVKDTLAGCTLTAGDAVELIDCIRMCTKPETETEVPEAINDLLYDCEAGRDCGVQDRIVEAYRRGQRNPK